MAVLMMAAALVLVVAHAAEPARAFARAGG